MLAQTSQGNDTKAVEDAIEVVNQSTAVFAERRMDSSISKALSGQSVDKV